MTSPLAEYREETLVPAIEANLVALLSYMGHHPSAEIEDRPEIMRFSTGLPSPAYNGAIRARVSEEAAPTLIADTKTFFWSRRVPALWWVGPSSTPANLASLLTARGFTPAADLPGMAVDIAAVSDGPTPDGIVIREVDDALSLRQWVLAATAGFRVPEAFREPLHRFESGLGTGDHLPWRRFIALQGNEPVGASALFLGAGVAGIYNVATAPEARRRGIGAATTLAALGRARDLGYRVSVLQSSPAGRGLYERLGYRQYCLVSQYLWKPAG